MVITGDAALAEKIRILRNHGMNPRYHHRMIGINSRLDALQAAVLRIKLRRLKRWTEERRENAARYRALFAETGLRPPMTLGGKEGGLSYLQPICDPGGKSGRPARSPFPQGLHRDHYPVPLHLRNVTGLGIQGRRFPESSRPPKRWPADLPGSRPQQRYVVKAIKEFFTTEGTERTEKNKIRN
jgi:dTDP-4-amino-4,6-dideoxygalactose transaminase